MFCMQVVGQKIAQLEQRKKAAVEKEDYDAAKLIKVGAGEGHCCLLGQAQADLHRLSVLEQRKKGVVEEEDYDAAKVGTVGSCPTMVTPLDRFPHPLFSRLTVALPPSSLLPQLDIDKLRAAGEAAAGSDLPP